ncbi:MAG: hypothetical protein WC748_06005 [Legionellales bacterium]|jgi:hypothetical protein
MASNAQYFHAQKLKQFGDNKNDNINADDLYITASNITEVKDKNDNINEKEFIPSEYINHEMLKINLKRISYYQQAVALLKSESRVKITVRDYKLLAEIYQRMSELAFELKYRYENDHQVVFDEFHNYHQEWDLESIDAKKKSIGYDNEVNDDKKLEIVKYICKLQQKYIDEEYNCNYLNIAGIETLESMSTETQNLGTIKHIKIFY